MQLGSGRVYAICDRRRMTLRLGNTYFCVRMGRHKGVEIRLPFLWLCAGTNGAGIPWILFEAIVWPRPDLNPRSALIGPILGLLTVTLDRRHGWAVRSDIDEISWRLAEAAGAERP